MRKTPLRAWVDADDSRSVFRLALAVGISRARLYHYLNGATAPTDGVRRKLCTATGLPWNAFDRKPLRARMRGRRKAA